MDNFIENKKIALFVVNLVSKMYHLDDAVLVEFHPASRFPNPEVTAMVTRDYRILYNIDRLKVATILSSDRFFLLSHIDGHFISFLI